MKFLFDLGGVFFDWNPKYFFNKIFDSDKELNFFLNEICNDDWNKQQDCGRLISDAVEELVKKFPKYISQIELYYPNHRKMIKGVFNESVRVLNKLKSQNFYCYVLSNWSAETFIGMENDYPFLNQFDGLVISGEEKMVKPQKEIYQLAIDRFNLIPNETVFIDDRLENISASIDFGFQTIHLKHPNEIEKEINKFL